MYMVCVSVWIVMAVAWSHPLVHAAEERPRLPLAMSAFLRVPEHQTYELHVHLTNVGQEPVIVDVRDLPWNPPNDAQWLQAVRMDERRSVISQRHDRARYGSRTIRVLPGESIQERMPMNVRIPSLLEDIAASGVQLRWTCPPPGLRVVCRDGAPTVVEIPKRHPGTRDDYPIDRDRCDALARAIQLIRTPPGHDVLFVLATTSLMEDVPRVRARLETVDVFVRECRPRWTNSWAVSFFTDKQYAGFVSDAKNAKLFEQGRWQHVHIGEYSSQVRTLYRFPWVKQRSEAVYLSVFRPD